MIGKITTEMESTEVEEEVEFPGYLSEVGEALVVADLEVEASVDLVVVVFLEVEQEGVGNSSFFNKNLLLKK